MTLFTDRLYNQKLAQTDVRRPEDIVSWLGAVQAQDYAGAKWALGLRTTGVSDADIDRVYDDGRILRTHLMRPTWHFVAPADIRWLLALTAPRVHAANAYAYRKFELDRPLLARCRTLFTRALRNDAHLTRLQLAAALHAAGIEADGLRLGYIVMHAELEGVICSGPRQGKQFTYALLDARVPPAPAKSTDDALGELARRYFTSHGPATVRDLAWWSGLTMREARRAAGLAGSALASETVGDHTFWRAASSSPAARRAARSSRSSGSARASHSSDSSVYLLPNYDEYLIAYKDRDIVMPTAHPRPARVDNGPELGYHLIVDGRVAGSWRKVMKTRRAAIEVRSYWPLTTNEQQALAIEAARFATFANVEVTLAHV